eukprot:5875589-Amphidinium_carterae.1
MGTGLDGVLGELATAVSNGRVQERLNNYLNKDPDALKKVGVGLEERLQNVLATTEATTTNRRSLDEAGPGVDVTAVASSGLGPVILVVAISVLATALCAGIATGTTCTLLMRQRHQPQLLLQDENAGDYAQEGQRRAGP